MMRHNSVSCGVLSGQVSFDEFLVGIRGVMNSRRKAIVQVAFDVLDKDGSGKHVMPCIASVDCIKSHSASELFTVHKSSLQYRVA